MYTGFMDCLRLVYPSRLNFCGQSQRFFEVDDELPHYNNTMEIAVEDLDNCLLRNHENYNIAMGRRVEICHGQNFSTTVCC